MPCPECKDLDRSVNEMCTNLWALVYPDDPNGWEYRNQPYVHVKAYIRRLKSEIESLKAFISDVGKVHND
jgi:hypothetical protein